MNLNLQSSKIYSYKNIKENLLKGRSLLLLPFLFFVISCKSSITQGDVKMYDSVNKKGYFAFTVDQNFERENSKSPLDKKYKKMTVSEVDLLTKILKNKGYCQKDSETSFVILSKQEKIYDMTFAHLIEENYKSRPLTPKTFFGYCTK